MIDDLHVERHGVLPGDEEPPCIGQWCCGCDRHPIGKPWGWNVRAWDEHYRECHEDEQPIGRRRSSWPPFNDQGIPL